MAALLPAAVDSAGKKSLQRRSTYNKEADSCRGVGTIWVSLHGQAWGGRGDIGIKMAEIGGKCSTNANNLTLPVKRNSVLAVSCVTEPSTPCNGLAMTS